jgi:hypothetical protein
MFQHPRAESLPRIATIRADQLQPFIVMAHGRFEEHFCPPRSDTLALVTTTSSNKPKTSTRRCCLRPVTCLAASYPLSSAMAVVLTDWLYLAYYPPYHSKYNSIDLGKNIDHTLAPNAGAEEATKNTKSQRFFEFFVPL